MSEVIHHMDPIPTVPTTVDTLLAAAVSRGASVEQLTQLLELKLRYEADEARKAFVTAMSEFRSVAPTIIKNKKGHTNKYASLDHITEVINPLLSKCGLSYGWVTEQGNQITVHCDVTHVQGHSMRVTLSALPDTGPGRNSIQAIGSAVSYLQRYTLLSALGLATGESDDDGKGAVRTVTSEQAHEIKQLMEKTGADVKRFLKVYGNAPSVDKLHVDSYEPAIAQLKTKAERMGISDAV